MRAFIVRPFGAKQEIDFDLVEEQLIKPALAAAGISGDTTAAILKAGNIRADMFELLLCADLVIADVTIDNANVFYELGVRHALRASRTVLIRAAGAATIPFDLRTDRYIVYDRHKLKDSVPLLADCLRQTAASESKDSPVFTLLPDLRETDQRELVPLPREFKDEAERAAAQRDRGRLGLLRWEARDFPWWSKGFRLIGRSQFQLGAFAAAERTWEELRDAYPADTEANLKLGTIYQRLGDLPSSDLAVDRVIQSSALPSERAEAFALLGRNEKARLLAELADSAGAARQARAAASRYLLTSYEHYRTGYLLDLNHNYSGLNALAMLTLTLQLAAKQPDVWLNRFNDDAEADTRRRELERQHAELASSVKICIEADQRKIATGKRDSWLEISAADHAFLTSTRPKRVVSAYANALTGTESFIVESARAQLQFYHGLGLFEDRCADSLGVFPPPAARPKPPARVILFTGHMVDAAKREKPRFPRDKKYAELAATAIRQAVEGIVSGEPGVCLAIAGGASGGDLLFHQACAQAGVPSLLRLTLPTGLFIAKSVAPAGPDWERLFRDTSRRLEENTRILMDSEAMPPWLVGTKDYNVWGRTNVWMFEEALAMNAAELHLIALWNGAPGDGPGGASHLVQLARQRGAIVSILDTNQLFGL